MEPRSPASEEWPRTGDIEWNRAYSLNILGIDYQHKTLVAQIRKLQDAMAQGRGREAIVEIVTNLVAYTKAHFAFEEKLLTEHEFPELEQHRAAHEELTRQVLAFQQKLEAGHVIGRAEMMVFLRHWLLDHILTMDKAYAGHLIRAGVR